MDPSDAFNAPHPSDFENYHFPDTFAKPHIADLKCLDDDTGPDKS